MSRHVKPRVVLSTPRADSLRLLVQVAEYKERVGGRIRAARERKGLSQAALARLLPGKIDGPSVSRWERGMVMPGADNLEALGSALDVDVAYFMAAEPTVGTAPLLDQFAGGGQLDRIETAIIQLARLLAAQEIRGAGEVAEAVAAAREAQAPKRRRSAGSRH